MDLELLNWIHIFVTLSFSEVREGIMRRWIIKHLESVLTSMLQVAESLKAIIQQTGKGVFKKSD